MGDFVNAILDNILNPLIYAFSAACFVWFLYGVVRFMLSKVNGEAEGIKKGKNHMLWGLIGIIIIFSAGAIYDFITGFFN